MSTHPSADQTLLLKSVVLEMVELNFPNYLIRVARRGLVRGIPTNTVVQMQLSSFMDPLWLVLYRKVEGHLMPLRIATVTFDFQ